MLEQLEKTVSILEFEVLHDLKAHAAKEFDC
jgi:hypothetical protein